MYNPIGTYRVQFHKGFTFSDFESIIPYLGKLGIKTIYASPIFASTPGSTHGYDAIDANRINPEIGTVNQLLKISKRLKKMSIGWLQDIVPNHMAFHPDNAWLMDVLEKGRGSAYANHFDILWDSPVYGGRLMVPFLGAPFNEVIADGQLTISHINGHFSFSYSGQNYPLNKEAHRFLSELNNQKILNKAFLKKINSNTDLLRQISDMQHYQLCFWQETDNQINFRRFFTVNGLICLNMQHQQVFYDYHQFIKDLIDQGVFQGLRVDHIDGLFDPLQYIERLRELAGPDTYIIVEKILETGEQFPEQWPVQGNTGYDFLATVNNLFTNRQSKQVFGEIYQKLTGNDIPVKQLIWEKKSLILHQQMAGELDNLVKLSKELVNTVPLPDIKAAIAELLVRFPVYRYYLDSSSNGNLPELAKLLTKISADRPALKSAVDELRLILDRSGTDKKSLRFYQRLMQFTGPLMAKGVEDTLMYTYNQFIDHNEVGDSPLSFGIGAKQVHQGVLERQKLWPLSMNATSTHDTKRGEDVRARLNVLTDLATEWAAKVKEWRKINEALTTENALDTNDEYFIYQTITGAYPMPGQTEDDFSSRLQEYLVKALREGKINSNWANPDENYENSLKQFIETILRAQSRFMQSFRPFLNQIVDFGIVNSLAQVLLKNTAPGMPDLYQGTELWDLSLVDPDNRRPVNYVLRNKLLKDKSADLWVCRYNGQIKQRLIQTLLTARGIDPDVFLSGEYIPLKIKGKYKDHVLAYARRLGLNWFVTAIPLGLAAISGNASPLDFDWKDTRIMLPPDAPLEWNNLLKPAKGFGHEGIDVKSLFSDIPAAFLKLTAPHNDRNGGILMHITSLPSAFGIGDIGPEAHQFIDLLVSARQKYWQLLPVNMVDKAAGFSPYSSSSGMAGNIWLISPELLSENGLLSNEVIDNYKIEAGSTINFDEMISLKAHLFDQSWQRFKEQGETEQFTNFKTKEAYWLDDFALYEILREKHQHTPWHQWPDEFRNRQKTALKELASEASDEINKVKWLQFVFATQWSELRDHAHIKGITLFGDMPFYVSSDSADVWANPDFFSTNGVAGVPPDYFSADGQLWGMPVYNWDALKNCNYSWWINRIKKNLEYFDVIRLDHFRAFDEYWEVPVGEKTAINGKWQKGPGADFFKTIKKELGYLPFVAEDLGDIGKGVFELRDKFNLPGMRVLQFAFDANRPFSDHIPHNYTVNSFAYTGTHDNNTLRGWYKEIDKDTRNNIRKYLDSKGNASEICNELIKTAYASVAKTVILPVQDLLGLDADARLNTPSSVSGNWTWRITGHQLKKINIKELRELAIANNR